MFMIIQRDSLVIDEKLMFMKICKTINQQKKESVISV